MKRKSSKPYPAPQFSASFPLRNICGTWVSLCGSPSLKIYHDGNRFRLQFIYKHDAAFTVPLCRSRGITFFYFYGMIRIAYDDERDMLLLTGEGEYKKVYD
jgi:hypothetical protein